MIWGCTGFEKLIELNNSVCIQLEPGCHMRIQNKTSMADDELGEHHLLPNFVDAVPGLIEFESIELPKNKDLTEKRQVFEAQREEFNRKIENQLQHSIQRIKLALAPDIEGILYCILAIISLTIILFICLRFILRTD